MQLSSNHKPDKEPDREIEALLTSRQFDQAETLIKEKLINQPNSADAYYLFGVMYFLKGAIGKTIENLKKTLSIDPQHTDAAICLSVLYNDIGKYDEAKQVFEQANMSAIRKNSSGNAEIDRKFAVKHLELADLYFRYRRYDEAIEEYGKAILLDSTALDLRIRRAKVFAKKGFVSRALQELEELKHEDPSFLPARIQLGLLHYSQNNVLDAELEWEAVLQIDQTNREAKAYIDMAKKSRVKN